VLQALASEAPDQPFDRRMVGRLHEQLCKQLARGDTFGSSTTLAAVRCYPDHCEVMNAGDSRVYHIPADGAWQQLSHDHSLINTLIAQGEAEAGVEYASFYYALDSCLVADSEESEFAIHRRLEPMAAGDTLLLCTDGVHDTLSDAQLQSQFSASLSPKEQAQVWRNAVLDAGAPDNFSLIVLRYDAPGGEQVA
jgi:PPM family protein phosphatase